MRRLISAIFIFGLTAMTIPPTFAQSTTFTPLTSLKDAQLPGISGLDTYIRNDRWAVVLGKALFWDMQAGANDQACASCHFHAGTDIRTKNTLNPGTRNENGPPVSEMFDPTRTNGGGPNYTLRVRDYPFHVKSNPADRHSPIVFDSDDVTSSQGVFRARFSHTIDNIETCFDIPDSVFNVTGINTRRVAPRNTPTMINAAFNLRNFWDGRANDVFNGVDPFGLRNSNAFILKRRSDDTVVRHVVRLNNSSLASQAVGPPLSFSEMSCEGRIFPDIGKKLISRRALARQVIHPQDGVLGRYRDTMEQKGLKFTYADLIKRAFRGKWWKSDGRFDANGKPVNSVIAEPKSSYSQMEFNFSLFWGLAIQEYERSLVSDETPLDRFLGDSMEPPDPKALSARQQRGLGIFLEQGRCVACHDGPLMTNATVDGLVANKDASGVVGRMLPEQAIRGPVLYDNGFYNIGVRPAEEDIGVGGLDAFGNGLSLAGQYRLQLLNLPTLDEFKVDPCAFDVRFTPESAGDLDGDGSDDPFPSKTTFRIATCDEGTALEPTGPEDVIARLPTAVAGAFKVPGLRNIALTGPYMHNGGMATLRQVIRFYNRGGDFPEQKNGVLDANIVPLFLTLQQRTDLVAFLSALTDSRVKWEKAPFDHPQLFVANGHPGDAQQIQCTETDELKACDDFLEIPAVGRVGRAPLGLPPLQPFATGLLW